MGKYPDTAQQGACFLERYLVYIPAFIIYSI